ncbi:MAG: hypothetical protein JSV85_06690 [Candidatus Bathyarchaeota archaeon]|nr:MAG: hypothetical protein JSV85_06690 [Candidatus Bathyarchaeota archaeon]
MRKKLLLNAILLVIAASAIAYAWVVRDGGTRAEENGETPSGVAKFEAVVNGMRSMDVFVCANISDGLTEKEAELIAGTTFIQVKGEHVWHRLDTLTFDDTQITAHYTWGYDKTDLGHIYDMTADLTTLQITVDYCF